MEDLEELYTNMNYIFSNDRCVTQSINDNLYQYDYIRVFVLCLAYLPLCNVPKKYWKYAWIVKLMKKNLNLHTISWLTNGNKRLKKKLMN